jgi:proteasome lid subunit RPN8/RPN11
MKIKEEALAFILGVSKKYHPSEFGGMLRGKNDVIEEVLVIPATTYGDGFVDTRMDMIPIDRSIIGSVHSHPGRDYRPSGADLEFFKKTGPVHLIARTPYGGLDDVAAYDRSGKRIRLSVL